MIMLGPLRPAAKFPTDCGPTHPDIAVNLRLARGPLVKFLNLDPVMNNQTSVMCAQGSATPLGVIRITTTYEVLHFRLDPGG